MVPLTEKIKIKTPIVEMDGDEMARVVWNMVKDRLLLPYLDLNVEYYDLHLQNRDKTDDQVTVDAANANMRYGVGVKCATITPNADRVEEYNLKRMWKSPNGTIRSMLDGTVFRKPILVKNIKPFVSTWKRSIIIGRHAYGDVYSNSEMRVAGPGKAELVFTPSDGSEAAQKTIKEFTGPGIIQGIYNTDESIRSFARACFSCAFDEKVDLWFSTKDTISKTYDARFREIFEEEYRENWVEKFRAVMMTSVLVSPHGYFEYEAAHGTVQKHYYKHLKEEETSTNSMAIIFAWAGSLRKRGELDGTGDLVDFARELEQAAIETVESGMMTRDLLLIAEKNPNNRKASTQEFIDAVAERLRRELVRINLHL